MSLLGSLALITGIFIANGAMRKIADKTIIPDLGRNLVICTAAVIIFQGTKITIIAYYLFIYFLDELIYSYDFLIIPLK